MFLIHEIWCVYLVSIVGPWAKGQVALLAVEGKVGNIHHTGALSDGRSVPRDLTIIPQNHVSVHRPGEIIIRPDRKRIQRVTAHSSLERGETSVEEEQVCVCERTGVLVIQHQIRPPHQAAGNADHLQTIILLFTPLQMGVVPRLSDPEICD